MKIISSSMSNFVRAAAVVLIGLVGNAAVNQAASAEWRWSATFEKKKGNNTLLIARDWNDFHKGWLKYQKNGFRLHDFEVQNNTAKYSGVFKKTPGNDPSQIRVSLETVMNGWKNWSKKGYRLQDFETWTENKKRYFGATYVTGGGAHALWVVPGWKKFHTEWAKFEKQGLRMHDFETWFDGSTQWYAGVFRAGKYPAGSSMGGNWDQFKKARADFRKKGYRLIDLEILGNTEGQKYYGLFGKTGPDKKLRVVNSQAGLLKARKGFKKAGYKIDDIEVTWFYGPGKLATLGDTKCQFGDLDCNKCANNVEAQFAQGMDQSWVKGSWDFDGGHRYRPDGMQPKNSFQSGGKHIQGFVRTNSVRYPYAGSHSHRKKGFIFFLEDKKWSRTSGNAKNVLYSMHKSRVEHPSGVSILGDGLFVAELENGKDYLRWFGINAAGDKQQHRYRLPGLRSAGGGLGLAKLSDGSSLLIVSHPGGGFFRSLKKKNLEPRHTRFFKLTPDAFRPSSDGIQLLGEQQHQVEAKPKKPYAYSENLSVVTECGSGSIYTIHTTGDWGLEGKGYWRLSKLEGGLTDPHLVFISMKEKNQHAEYCHHRSAATVHVNKHGKLEFLCSERAVIKKRRSGRFDFRRSIVR